MGSFPGHEFTGAGDAGAGNRVGFREYVKHLCYISLSTGTQLRLWTKEAYTRSLYQQQVPLEQENSLAGNSGLQNPDTEGLYNTNPTMASLLILVSIFL